MVIILGLLVVVAFVLVLSQYSGYKEPEQGIEPGETEVGETEEISQSQEEIDKIIDEAIVTQDISLCEKIKDENIKKTCKDNAILAEARVKGDPTICDQLEDEYLRTMCKEDLASRE